MVAVRLLPLQVGARLAGAAGGLVQPCLGRRLLLDQLPLSPPLDLGQVQRRLGAGDRGIDVLDLGLVGRLLDHEQEIADLDVLTLGEQPLLQETVDPGAQVHLVHGLDPAGEAGRGRDVARLQSYHRDGGRLLGQSRATGHPGGQQECQPREAPAGHARPFWQGRSPFIAERVQRRPSQGRDRAGARPMQRRTLRLRAAVASTYHTRR